MRTRSQTFAISAYDNISAIASDQTRARYATTVHRLPAIIHQFGLAHAVEFVAARSTGPDDGAAQFLEHLASTLGRESADAFRTDARGVALVGYMRLTRRALEAIGWYKRLVESAWGLDASADDEGVL